MATRSLYKSALDREVVARWCRARLDGWAVVHRRREVEFSGGTAHLTLVGDGEPGVVFVPGTNFNAATSLDVAAALGERWATVVVDLPGQPGLSGGERPAAAHRGWYGRVLGEILDAIDARDVVVVGHSLGAAVALTCDTSRVAGRVLVSPAGLVPLRAGAGLVYRSMRWLLRPTPERTRALLAEYFTAPGAVPPEDIVAWMTLMPRHCRSTLAPPPLPPEAVRRWAGTPHVVATGAHDYFVPPGRLAAAVGELLDSELREIEGGGHLVVDERPKRIVELVDAVRAQCRLGRAPRRKPGARTAAMPQDRAMDSRHLARIERVAGVDGLTEILAERLSPSDLQSLLLEVHRRRAGAVTPAQLLRRYHGDRFGKPSDVAPGDLHTLDGMVLPVLDAAGFTAVALSPVCPLGTNSVVSSVPQNNVVSTGRNSEVIADATNVLALECATRRQTALAGDPRDAGVVKLAASQRILRGQPFDTPGRSPHFVLLALCTAGRDVGGFGFETEALTGNLAAQLRAIDVLGRNGYHFDDVRVRLTDLTGGRKPVLDSRVLSPLTDEFPEVDFGFDDERTSGRGYYREVSLAISARNHVGERITFADGGFTDWTAQLLGNAKERLLTGGLGLELVHRLFRRG